MQYCNERKCQITDVPDKTTLREMLGDYRWTFSIAELQAIIQNEFFNDENTLDAELVDAALVRLLRMYGKKVDKTGIQRERELLVCDLLRRLVENQK